jgi:hypothetical protein
LAQDPGWQFAAVANDPEFERLVSSPH